MRNTLFLSKNEPNMRGVNSYNNKHGWYLPHTPELTHVVKVAARSDMNAQFIDPLDSKHEPLLDPVCVTLSARHQSNETRSGVGEQLSCRLWLVAWRINILNEQRRAEGGSPGSHEAIYTEEGQHRSRIGGKRNGKDSTTCCGVDIHVAAESTRGFSLILRVW